MLNSRLELVGYTIGNDMSSRDIEGENPLYLPQAKLYDQSCALGPWVTLAHDMPPRKSIGIALSIVRGDELVFEGKTNVGQMARKFEELIEYLGATTRSGRRRAVDRHGHCARRQFHARTGRRGQYFDRRHRHAE